MDELAVLVIEDHEPDERMLEVLRVVDARDGSDGRDGRGHDGQHGTERCDELAQRTPPPMVRRTCSVGRGAGFGARAESCRCPDVAWDAQGSGCVLDAPCS